MVASISTCRCAALVTESMCCCTSLCWASVAFTVMVPPTKLTTTSSASSVVCWPAVVEADEVRAGAAPCPARLAASNCLTRISFSCLTSASCSAFASAVRLCSRVEFRIERILSRIWSQKRLLVSDLTLVLEPDVLEAALPPPPDDPPDDAPAGEIYPVAPMEDSVVRATLT